MVLHAAIGGRWMRLFITIEAENSSQNGLADIFRDVDRQLSFVTGKNDDLPNVDNYGSEFREIAIIPSCVSLSTWEALGWKERQYVWRKKREADIRLRMDYERFVSETPENKRLLFVDIIIKSIKVLQTKSKGDFRGDALIADILNALGVTPEQLSNLANTPTN
jgi:hypothetical protein